MMATQYPSGITTRRITMGVGTRLEDGTQLGIQATIKASRQMMVWEATDTPMPGGTGVPFNADEGLQAEAVLPVTDQEGWSDGKGGVISVDDGKQTHYYQITGFFTLSGRPIAPIQVGPFALPTGDGSDVDVDDLVPVSSTGGVVVSIPDSWSAQVAAAQAAAQAAADSAAQAATASDDAVASLIADATSETRVRLNGAFVAGRACSLTGTFGLPEPTGVGLEFVIGADGLDDIRMNGVSL